MEKEGGLYVYSYALWGIFNVAKTLETNFF